MVVHTPRLCGEPVFVGGAGSAEDAANEKRRKAVSWVDCRPVVKDELLLQAQNDNRALQQQQSAVPEVALQSTQHKEESQVCQSPHRCINSVDDTCKGNLFKHQMAMRNHQLQRMSSHSLTQSEDTHSDTESHQTETLLNQELLVDSFVLVVDPVTGELVIEGETEHNRIFREDKAVNDKAGSEGQAGRTGQETALDDFVKLLQKSIESALEKVASVEEATPTPKDGNSEAHDQASEQKRPLQQPHQEAQQPQAPRGKGRPQDTLSRLSVAGSHNHKAIAEQFLSGQLKHKRKLKSDFLQANQMQNQQPPAHPRQLGTPQHRSLKEAFSTKWDGSEEDQKQRPRDEL